jgi:HSP20 family molecular chaperone IbpA
MNTCETLQPCSAPTGTQQGSQSATVTPVYRRPRYTLENRPDAHELKLEIPGVTRDTVSLRLSEGVLEVTAERKTSVPDSWRPLHRELSDAGYRLQLQINDRVDESGITANLDNGVLTLRLPIKAAAQPRSIPVM